LIRIAQRELDELLGDDGRCRVIVIFRPQLRDHGADLARPRLPKKVPQSRHPLRLRDNGAVKASAVRASDPGRERQEAVRAAVPG
jgi:hypothetical protein